jgi:hypothetical protein
MSDIPVKNQLKKLTMLDVMGIMNDYGGLAKSCRFAVKINPPRFITSGSTDNKIKDVNITNDLVYLCEAAEMPGRGFVNADVRYYGPNQKLPVLTQYEDTTMTFLCRTESYERQFFDDWMEYINPTNSFNFNYRNDYETTIEIMQFSEYAAAPTQVGPNPGTQRESRYPEETYRITLFNAYPLLVNPQPMTWADDQLMRLAVTFTYHKWKRVGRDAEPKSEAALVEGATNITGEGSLTPINYR